MNILVTGSLGQLGSEIQTLAALQDHNNFIFTDRDELDITNAKDVNDFFDAHKFDVCINCAAYTAVDKAETDVSAAYLVNDIAVENLAKACIQNKSLLIHISTDYVFDGSKTEAYTELDAVGPQGIYGKSKLAGEQKIFDLFKNETSATAVIIRTAWVYSFFGNNFVKTMMRLMNERPMLKVVHDQKGSPTYAADLAAAIFQIINQPEIIKTATQPLLLNYSNEGTCTWFEFAQAIANKINYTGQLLPITTAEYPTPAKRPANSLLNKSKIKNLFNISIPEWQDSLQICMQKLS